MRFEEQKNKDSYFKETRIRWSKFQGKREQKTYSERGTWEIKRLIFGNGHQANLFKCNEYEYEDFVINLT